jgi:hypothetical protein
MYYNELKNKSIIVLPLAGFITMFSLFLRGPLILPTNNIDSFVESITHSNFALTWILLFMGTFLTVYGVLALYNVIKDSESKWSLWAMILTIAGLLIFLPTTGIITFAGLPAAQLYIQGQTVAMQVVINALNNPLNLGFLITSAFIYTIGCCLFAVSIWKSKTLPVIAGVLFALHGPLVTFGAATSYYAEATGGILLFISGLWIAWSVLNSK